MAEGRARLIIDFKSREALVNYVGWLREDKSTHVQPFGADVNAFVYEPADDIECPEENVVLLVPGHRVPEREGSEPLLPVPEPEAMAAVPQRRGPGRRPRGVPDQPFAPHGTPGGPTPPSGSRHQGTGEPAPY